MAKYIWQKRILKNIASINNPNVYGTGCNFVNNAVQWTQSNQEGTYGLPTFIQSYFYPADSFKHTINCVNLTGTFNYTPLSDVLSVKWDFDDPSTGANNTSTSNNPVHVFSAAGSYTVKLIRYTHCGSDTLEKKLSTDGLDVYLGADTLVCGSTSLLLNGPCCRQFQYFSLARRIYQSNFLPLQQMVCIGYKPVTLPGALKETA